jgi:maltose O-acetyltransferase
MPTQGEKMLAGEVYDPFDPELVAARARARDMSQQLNATHESGKRSADAFCATCSERWRHRMDATPFLLRLRRQYRTRRAGLPQFQLRRPGRLPCADRRLHPVRASGQIYTPLHPFNAEQRRRVEFGKPIDIASDVWVGGGAIILAGVRIGSRAVIGAGSVVTRDVPEAVFAAGNPCRVIRDV